MKFIVSKRTGGGWDVWKWNVGQYRKGKAYKKIKIKEDFHKRFS
jgi:hypothetical protein